jgi:oligopeptide/dipeptide ABC transporter ATP-binding protein
VRSQRETAQSLPAETLAGASGDGTVGRKEVRDGDILLSVRDLDVRFRGGARLVHAVQGLSFDVLPGRTLAVIGESGSGKTVSARALVGLLPAGARVSGSARLGGQELIGLAEKDLRQVRGRDIAIVPQDPARSLNPTMPVGKQITEAVRAHVQVSAAEARRRAVDLLGLVRVAGAERRFSEYPHQLSGGMRQRVVIAIALACQPRILIADEATTALDVTTQSQIMELLAELQGQFGMALIMISHDLGLAACYSDHVIVMYAGRAVESAPTPALYRDFRSPYTKALLEAVPRLGHGLRSYLPPAPRLQPGLARPAVGCSFAPRCPNAREKCSSHAPGLIEHEPGHQWACWYPVDPRKAGGGEIA